MERPTFHLFAFLGMDTGPMPLVLASDLQVRRSLAF